LQLIERQLIVGFCGQPHQRDRHDCLVTDLRQLCWTVGLQTCASSTWKDMGSGLAKTVAMTVVRTRHP